MEIRISDKYVILTPLTPKIDAAYCNRLFGEIKENYTLDIGIDLSYVKDCTIEFIETLKQYNKVSLYNIPSDIFALINIMNIDKCVNLFVNESDFRTKQRRILNRRFSIV